MSRQCTDGPVPELSFPDRAALIRKGAARLCLSLSWAPLHEVVLPNGRRADILALTPSGNFVCIEVKSGLRDFQADRKWSEYREFSDLLYFATDADFPAGILPEEVGRIVVAEGMAEIVLAAPEHKLAAGRRRTQLHRFALLACQRLAIAEDPGSVLALRNALRPE